MLDMSLAFRLLAEMQASAQTKLRDSGGWATVATAEAQIVGLAVLGTGSFCQVRQRAGDTCVSTGVMADSPSHDEQHVEIS